VAEDNSPVPVPILNQIDQIAHKLGLLLLTHRGRWLLVDVTLLSLALIGLIMLVGFRLVRWTIRNIVRR
jgi:hypothetical protein